MEKDLNNLTKEELISKIKQLQKEKKLNHNKYGLVWDSEKEPEQVVEQCKKEFPILKNIKSKDIKTDDSEDNILIEGDNYHALQVLNYTHKNKIDVIYIDPPYNTGNKDFKYNDTFVDKEDGYRHSKWLNFMSKRLELARNLLAENGVIFISIDDNEYANLKLLCDKIFGENNFVAVLKWKKKKQPSFLDNHVSSITEYILIFSKNKKNVGHLSVENIAGSSKPLFNAGNKYVERSFQKGIKCKYEKGKILKGFYKNKTVELEYLDDVLIDNYRTLNPFSMKAHFRDAQENINRYIEEDVIYITKNNSLRRDILKSEIDKEKNILDLICNWGQNQDAFDELLNLFGKKDIFKNPKPTLLIKNIISASTKNNETILDFFAGSGTTGHAVLELNKQDGGNRKFILCTNNENNICTDVCYPRISKIIKGYKTNSSHKELLFEEKISINKLKKIGVLLEEIENIIKENKDKYDRFDKVLEDTFIKLYGLKEEKANIEGFGSNLKYFKTGFIENSKNITQSKINISKNCAEMLCIKTGIFNEIEDNQSYKIFDNNTHAEYLCIFYDFYNDNMKKFISSIKKLKGIKHIFLFSLDLNIEQDLFEDIPNAFIEPIPQKILDIYKKLSK